jgi:sugar diacid utilization regulator
MGTRPRKTAAASADGLRASPQQLQRENETLRLLVAIHDRLGALVLEGADAAAITVALSEMVDRPVLLLDGLMRPVVLEPRHVAEGENGASILWDPNDAYVGRVLQTMASERRSMRLPPLPAWGVNHGCVLAPVVAGDATLGYLAILESDTADASSVTSADAELLAAQHAASVYALALMRERLAAEVTTELRDELLEGLLVGNVTDEQATRERARRLGYDEALAYQALVLVPQEDTTRTQPFLGGDGAWAAGWRRRVLDSVAQLIRDRAPKAIVSRRPNELVVLLPDGLEPSPSDLGRTVTLYVASMYPEWPLTVGIGGVCHTPREISKSYAQARRAAEVALRFGRKGEVVNFDDLGLYRLIFQIEDRQELRAFVEQVLGPLLEYDRKHRTDFARTIRAYLANNNSLQSTAKELFVHVNTAAYRIQRIQAITGLELAKTEDCLLARVALMILEDEAVG